MKPERAPKLRTAIRRRGQNRVLLALSLVASVLTLGTCGYHVLEDYPAVEALYMSVITVATVGFGEIHPLSETGRLFTIALILVGFGSLAFAGHTLAESLIEKTMSKNSERKRMERRIKALRNHAIICGYGRVGEAAAAYLHQKQMPLCVIEQSKERIELLKEYDIPYVEGNATEEEALLGANIQNASSLLTLLQSDAENLFLVLSARELNPTLYIVARAELESSRAKTLRAGADRVLLPHATAGRQIAEALLSTTGDTAATQVRPPSSLPTFSPVLPYSPLAGKTIEEAERSAGSSIIGVRRARRDMLLPKPTFRLRPGDLIVTLQGAEKPEKTRSEPPKRILFVDDNPSILRLYVRLLRRRGFSPVPARNAAQALKLFHETAPHVAVIEYNLPDLPGDELCAKLRSEAGDSLKIIVFTASEDPALRQEVLGKGADAIVLKSSNASEVVTAVAHALNAEERAPERAVQPT